MFHAGVSAAKIPDTQLSSPTTDEKLGLGFMSETDRERRGEG